MIKQLFGRITMLSLAVLLFLQAAATPTTQAKASTQQDDSSPKPLCLPGYYSNSAQDCLPLGASQTLATQVSQGIPYPMRHMPIIHPDPALNKLPIQVAKINLDESEPAPYYASYDDAVNGVNPMGFIAAGHLRYISYIYRADYNGKAILQTEAGTWMRAAPAAHTSFQGLIFTQNPTTDFGWIVDETPAYTAPSFNATKSGKTYYRENIIQIFAAQEAEGVMWYLIAPNEWVNSLKSRRIQVSSQQPEGVGAPRWIEINLLEQTLEVYENGQLLFATIIASGLDPFFTQPGVFQIYKKLEKGTMQGAFEADRSDFYYLQDVPWTLYYDKARALHAAYWRTFFGYPQSHGCVNLSPGDAHWLYDWANEGDFVYVYDPSGKTPTDPEQYSSGAP